LKNLTRRLDGYETQLRQHDPRMRLGAMRRQLDSHTADLGIAVGRLFVGRRTELERLTVALARVSETVLLRRRSRWERIHSNLQALSPKAILARGYALVFDANGRLVKEASQLQTRDRVRTQLGRGAFTAKVDKVKESG